MLKLFRYPACVLCRLLILFIATSFTLMASKNNLSYPPMVTELITVNKPSPIISKYHEWNLTSAGIPFEVFNYAFKGC